MSKVSSTCVSAFEKGVSWLRKKQKHNRCLGEKEKKNLALLTGSVDFFELLSLRSIWWYITSWSSCQLARPSGWSQISLGKCDATATACFKLIMRQHLTPSCVRGLEGASCHVFSNCALTIGSARLLLWYSYAQEATAHCRLQCGGQSKLVPPCYWASPPRLPYAYAGSSSVGGKESFMLVFDRAGKCMSLDSLA